MANVNPGVKTLKIPGRKIRFQELPYIPGGDVSLASTFVDSGNGLARTTLIRTGNVVVKKTADGLYYLANDGTNGDRNGVGSVSALEAASAAWNSLVLTFKSNGGGSFTVTLGAGTATEAAAVTDLTADARFKANFIADIDGGGKLRINTIRAGADQYVFANAGARAATFGASGASGQGSDADYRVLGGDGLAADMLDSTAVASQQPAPTLIAGAFTTAQLLNSTPEALAVLARRGSIFA